MCCQPESELRRAREVFEQCVGSSSWPMSPRGAVGGATGRQRVADQVQQDNVFVSSAVKLSLRKSVLDSLHQSFFQSFGLSRHL